jgi:hypothetical protein
MTPLSMPDRAIETNTAGPESSHLVYGLWSRQPSMSQELTISANSSRSSQGCSAGACARGAAEHGQDHGLGRHGDVRRLRARRTGRHRAVCPGFAAIALATTLVPLSTLLLVGPRRRPTPALRSPDSDALSRVRRHKSRRSFLVSPRNAHLVRVSELRLFPTYRLQLLGL